MTCSPLTGGMPPAGEASSLQGEMSWGVRQEQVTALRVAVPCSVDGMSYCVTVLRLGELCWQALILGVNMFGALTGRSNKMWVHQPCQDTLLTHKGGPCGTRLPLQ
jgi:hypothetical protein